MSEGELRLVELWDGHSTAVELAALASTTGLDLEAGQVEAFFSRLSRIGVLAVAPPVVPAATVPPIGVKAASDIVPSFRGDLELQPAPGVRGVIHVSDHLDGRTFTLYDFEVSVARMLNGRRPASEVLVAAERLGVPVTLAGLRAFIAHLRALRFLDSKPPHKHTTWRPRRVWSDEVRDLYQQALKLARRGDRHEALSCLESVLEVDPQNEEAHALSRRLSDTSGRPAIGTSFELLHALAPPEVVGPAVKPEYPLAQGDDPFLALEAVGRPEPQHIEPAVGGAPALWPEVDVSGPMTTRDDLSLSQRQEVMARKRTFWPLVTAASVLALLLAALFRPVRAFTVTPCSVEWIELEALRTPFAGPVAVDATSGKPVEVGQVVARMVRTARSASSSGSLEAKLTDATKRRARLASGSPAKVARAKRRLAQAEAQLQSAMKQHAKLTAQRASPRRLAAAERSVKAKEVAVARDRDALEALTHTAELEALDRVIAETRAQLEASKGTNDSPEIRASRGGHFIAESRPPGALEVDPASEALPKGAIVGRVIDPSLQVSPKQAAVPPTGRYEVRVGDLTLEGRSDGARLVVDGVPSLAGQPCMVTVPEGRTPWVLSLLR